MTIATIARAPRPLSQIELAHKLAIENPTMVSMLDQLVIAGLVQPQPSRTNRRIKRVVLTGAGNTCAELETAIGA